MQQHSTWINNLLDGELSAHDEPSLFGELSVNSDLRTEFKQQLAIRSAVQNDRMALVPPAHLTNTVFSGLGFAAPMAGAAAGAAGGGFLLPWLMKLGLPILSAAAAIGVTMAVSNAPTNQNASGIAGSAQNENIGSSASSESRSDASNTAANSTANSNAANSSAANSDAEEMLAQLRAENRRLRGALSSTQERLADEQSQPRSAPPAVPATRDVTPPVAVTPTVASDADSYERPQMMAVGAVDVTNTIAFDNTRDLQSIQTQIMPATITYTPYPSPMLQVRGFAASALADVNVPNQSVWYENFAVAFLYQTSEKHAFGVEIGSEAFPQRFEGQSNGQTIRYEQRPSSIWWGGLYRFTAGALGKTAFSPFVQPLAGGTQYGLLGRLTLGMQYSPTGPLSFIVGVEGTMLGYKFQDSWFTSSKLGLTYGMAVRL